ncbi:MAG TPA: hypothetical protein VMU16_14785 [Candidatus Binataceae bacterium]|nr:hypothetical protein [Candidatus Binataceae bacterium]
MMSSIRDGRPEEIQADVNVASMPRASDLIVTPCEVNELHGTGTLLLRMFPDSSSIISLRTSNFYEGTQDFGGGQLCLPLAQASRGAIGSWLKWYLAGTRVRRILSLPYLPADCIVSLAVKEMSGAPLCTYIMDDKNVCAEGISDALMEETLAKSDLRLVISPEMREAYEKKYRMKFWVMPPLVPEEIIRRTPVHPPKEADPRRGVLLGNIWGQRWLEMIQETFCNSGFQIDWYCNQKNPNGLDFDRARMEQNGLRLLDPIREADLPDVLSKYFYAVVPTDTLDGNSPPPVQAIAELSLPSRIPTLVAAAHLPVLVLGSPRTSAARFVERFRLGTVTAYDTGAVRAALAELLKPEIQADIRRRAAQLSGSFSAKDSGDWIWRSLEGKQPCDPRYESLMPPEEREAA